MKRLYTIVLLALAAVACIQDPEAPNNLPVAPALSVDESSVTRVSMVANVTFGNMADVTDYGVEVSETLFEAGGTYKTIVPQQASGNDYSAGVSDLTSNTMYFLRAYIGNGHSRMYSDILTQKTPETSVASVSDVTIKDNYYLVATIEDNGGRSIEDVGFIWGTANERKSIKREKRYPGTLSEDGKTFTLSLSDVGEGTHYIMAYAEDDKDGTGYSRIPYEFVLNIEDEAQIEDPEFKKYLVENHDYNQNGKISYAELKQIEFIDVHTDNIRSVREIEQMPLHSLLVSGKQEGSGKLTSLIVKKDTLLMTVDCRNNQLKELDASMIPNLEYLNCEGNPMEVLYLSWYQKFNELRYPEGCRIVYVDKPDQPIQEGQPNNEIWYTTTDGSIVVPNEGASFGEGVSIVSNTYENGKGVLKFDKDVTMIGEYAFFNMSTLAGFIAPPSVQVIGRDAFYKCVSLLDISLPEGLVRISEHAFDHCESLVEVTIPESVEVINMSPFVYCTSLQHFYGKFADSTHRCLIWKDELLAVATAGLSSFTVPAGVTNIVEEAFAGMSQLTEIILPEGLKTIGWYVFEGCSSLRHIIIPSSVGSIGEDAFAACKGLEDITVEPINPPAGGQGMFGGTFCPIYVHAESLAAYKSAQYWSEYADRIQAIPGEITASKYLTFTSEGTTKLSLKNESGNAPVLYYSSDAANWTQWDYSELSFTAETPLYICGDNPKGFSSGSSKISRFTTEGDSFSVS
ncbi:MAG: leucine-rich repeat protein, partial [Bacteroidales bacterium]|nr:leucine-rich repeat protein [Bacteroidales bacterium]